MSNVSPKAISWTQVWTILGGIAAWTVVHAYLVVPRILTDLQPRWREDDQAVVASLRSERTLILEALGNRLLAIEKNQGEIGVKIDDIRRELKK